MRTLVVALALCAVAVLPACKRNSAPAQIVIGSTLPLTGSEARIGGFYKEGYELAFDEVDKAGGLLVGGKRVPVKLILLDDTSTQATAANLADRLINSDKAQFFLGTYASHLTEAQSVVAEQNGVPYVCGGAGSSQIYQHGYKWVFGLLAPIENLAIAQLEWIDEQQKAGKLPKPSKIAVLWENTSHGKEFQNGVKLFVDKHPGQYEISVNESFELNGKDFGALLGKVKAAAVDLFLADAHLPDYITIQRQYTTLGLCHKVQSFGARGSEKQAADALGPEHVRYILSAVWWSPQLSGKPAAKKFIDSFQAKNKKTPEWYQALGYETARALFLAIEQAGTLDREAVRAKLAALDTESLLPGGRLSFPKASGQQALYPFVVQQNQADGTSPIVWPKDAASAPGVAPNPACP